MTDRIKPNGKNRLSSKDILKRSAALTLLLSTVACLSSGNKDVDTMIWVVCPVLFALIGFVGHLKIVTGKNDNKKK